MAKDRYVVVTYTQELESDVSHELEKNGTTGSLFDGMPKEEAEL